MLDKKNKSDRIKGTRFYPTFLYVMRGRDGLVIRSRPRDKGVAGSKYDSTEEPPCMGPAARHIVRSSQTPYRWSGAEAWSGGTSSGVALVIRPRLKIALE
ncbi:hypothetical protein AVEN_159086-1 [Araneus ventricosus]|uniref:Uncharacterized protein n=1 Tax=Araneus ventricosus TaxID=182803 RepID=A0A4Y2BAP5_ARAVE|nr:hypothetical protein AVEN_159086-1 [Araneus ventricosus]